MDEDDLAEIFSYQFLYLRQNEVEIDDAATIAYMRTELIRYGCLYTKEIRCIQRDEIVILTQEMVDAFSD